MSDIKREIFEYIKANLTIRVEDASEPSSCGGEVPGISGVKASLFLKDPDTGKDELISENRCYIG